MTRNWLTCLGTRHKHMIVFCLWGAHETVDLLVSAFHHCACVAHNHEYFGRPYATCIDVLLNWCTNPKPSRPPPTARRPPPAICFCCVLFFVVFVFGYTTMSDDLMQRATLHTLVTVIKCSQWWAVPWHGPRAVPWHGAGKRHWRRPWSDLGSTYEKQKKHWNNFLFLILLYLLRCNWI